MLRISEEDLGENCNAVSVKTKWKSFESEVAGSLSAFSPLQSSRKMNLEWEVFD